MQKYNFEFVDFRLINISFAIQNDFSGPEPEEDVKLGTRLDVGYEKDGKELKVFVKIELDENDVPFVLSIEGGGLFSFNNELSKEDIDPIAKINCAAIIFPYIRESIADITRRAGFPPLHLPPVNFVEIYKKMGDEKTLPEQ